MLLLPTQRTCNPTVMNGRIAISFVDFTVFSVDFGRVRCGLPRSFWYGSYNRNLDLGRCVLFGRR